jgi:exodeoxyribonuclease VIII
MSYTDVSIDLETLGTKPGSVITQIGLCAFNRRPQSGGEASKASTLIRVSPQSCLDVGMKIDWDTVAWWLKQDEAPRLAMAEQKGVHINSALMAVGDFFAEHNVAYKGMCVWGHGCGFDCTQLEIAFNYCNLPVPWDFRKVRDLRTLIDLKPAVQVTRPTPAMAHNAMDDATAQAEWIQKLTAAIEKRHVSVHADQPQG